jgi:carbonic anhydrase/acetyltransferase-like protein (isoleucine patch superfamily)
MPGKFSFRGDLVAATAYIVDNATVLGDVRIGEHASIWFGAVIRGDTESIRIGDETNVQDLCVVHADPGYPCQLGARVTVGHAAIVHGATVEDEVLIGMRAVVLNGAKIGAGSIIAAGCVVPEGMIVPPHSLVMGMPGKVKRETNEKVRARIARAAAHYVELARQYRGDVE